MFLSEESENGSSTLVTTTFERFMFRNYPLNSDGNCVFLIQKLHPWAFYWSEKDNESGIKEDGGWLLIYTDDLKIRINNTVGLEKTK